MQMATSGIVNHAKVMRVIYRNTRLDHLTLKLTMTTRGCLWKCYCGSKGRRKTEMSQGASLELGVGALNVGAMRGKGGELVNMMGQRKVDQLYQQ